MPASPNPRAGQPERRVHHKIRAVFSEACALIAPLLDEKGAADNPVSPATILKQRYPELSALEIHVLLTAATRVRQEQSART